MAFTNGSELPSMIGTSGPSSSITALSMPQADNAAIKCSIVATVTPDWVTDHRTQTRIDDTVPARGTTLSRSATSVRTKESPSPPQRDKYASSFRPAVKADTGKKNGMEDGVLHEGKRLRRFVTVTLALYPPSLPSQITLCCGMLQG
jgi:hypothetical protein